MIVLALILAAQVQDTSRLTIEGAARAALGQYPTVGIARAAQSRALADVRETRSQLLPHITLDGSMTQFQYPMLVYPIHGFGNPNAVPPILPPGKPVTFDRTLIQGSANLNWTLFDFGARRGRTNATRSLVEASDAALSSAEQALIARTAGAYLRVLSARQTLAAQDRRIASLAAESERTRRMLAEGKIARLEVLRADAALARARAERASTAGQLDGAEHELSQFTNRPWERITRDTMTAVALRDSGIAGIREQRGGLISQALETSPEITEARHRADAAHASERAAKATRLPEFRVNAGLVDRGGTGTEFLSEWQAGVGISYPIYTGGQRNGAIDRARADAVSATESRRLAEANVASGVDRAIATVIETHASVEALKVADEQSLAVAEIERTSLEVGSGTQTDYLEALALALQARSQLIQARHTEIAARIELARVTGVLTPDWLASNLESVP